MRRKRWQLLEEPAVGRGFHIRSAVVVVTWEVVVSAAGELSRRAEVRDGEGVERLLGQDAHSLLAASWSRSG